MNAPILLGERAFTGDDQLAFARLSGDFNPMHVDEVAARRTIFGQRVVHGIHLTLWALDRWAAHGGFRFGLERISADFKKGVLVGEQLQCVLAQSEPEVVLRIERAGEMVSQFKFQFALSAPDSTAAPALPPPLPPPPPVECRELSFDQAAQATGEQSIGLEPALAAGLFPAAAALLPLRQMGVLLASTRIVGMLTPGLHSLYLGLKLQFSADAPDADGLLRYQAEKANPRVGILTLAVAGAGATGSLQTFFRPAPCAQPGFEQLRSLVAPGEFAGQTALVIGGSRGLGEVTAKLLAAGGAHVLVSYQQGQRDAEAVVAGIAAGGGAASAVAFDIRRPGAAVLPARPTHVYYFATPKIALEKNFSAERLRLFVEFYVNGFVESLLSVGEASQALAVLYPSTIFLDQPEPNTLEYTAAKAAGEEACRQLMRRHPAWRITWPRLPRLATDQNAGVLPSQLALPAEVLLPELRRLAG
jgi:hypothetical protein